MSEMNWYHGDLSRTQAEDLLRQNGFEEGLFLVRKSKSALTDFVLCAVVNQEVIHYQIQRRAEDALFSLSEVKTVIHGLDELIFYYMNQPSSGLQHKLTKFVPGEDCPTSVRLNGVENLLHRSTYAGHLPIVEEILKSGDRDIAAKNHDGNCAIHLAAWFGHLEILALLIDFGANVNVTNSSGYTPLHVACQADQVEVVKLLLESKANPTIRNHITSWSPLHEASWLGHENCAQVLIFEGQAPIQPRTGKDETPSDLAKANKMLKMAEFLDNIPVSQSQSRKEDFFCTDKLDRKSATELLLKHHPKDGTFLIRKNTKNKNLHVISLLFEGHKSGHFLIDSRGIYHFLDEGPYFSSLEHLVDHYSRFADGLPCKLTYPLFHHVKLGSPSIPPRPENRARIGSYPSHLKPVDNREAYKNHEILRQVRHSRDNIPKDSLLTLEVIGEGEYGRVFKGIYMPAEGKRQNVAVKRLNADLDGQKRKLFEREAGNMMQLDHHCIVQLIGISQEPPTMVLELVPLGSMLDYLQANGDSVRVELELPLWAAQVACGMLYLESKRFIHRDLAARNILLASKMQVKISDFGLSTLTAQGKDYYQASQGGRWPIKWYAPECVNYGTFTHAGDVWSFGILLWEMYSFGDQPYQGLTGAETVSFIESGKRLLRPIKAELEIYSTMTWCWEYEPSKRPKFSELYQIFSESPEYANLKELLLTQDMEKLAVQ